MRYPGTGTRTEIIKRRVKMGDNEINALPHLVDLTEVLSTLMKP
jgi:hypothetical protein